MSEVSAGADGSVIPEDSVSQVGQKRRAADDAEEEGTPAKRALTTYVQAVTSFLL